MTPSEIISILPLVIPGAAIVILMMLIAFMRSYFKTVVITMLSLFLSLIALFVTYQQQPRQITPLLVMDGYAYFYIGLIYAATIVICAISYRNIRYKNIVREEYYLFLITTALGSAVLVSSNHLASLLIGIELLSLSLYVLIAYAGTKRNIESGIKYFIMTGVSVAFLLFGISLIYAANGSMKFPEASQQVLNSNSANSFLYLAGIGLFMVGICFKLALVPFHFWIADVFEGSSAPVAGFIGTVSKSAFFAALIRFYSNIDILRRDSLYFMFASIAIASMFFGNITALRQTNIKRILAYSSIAHFGYLLVTLAAGNSTARVAAAFYLTAYLTTTLIAFGIITLLSKDQSELDAIEDYRGLSHRHPFYAGALSIAMLSLAGIPLTAGFIAKFYIITAGANTKLWTLLIILIINSAIGLYYYLRIVIVLYMPSPQQNNIEDTVPLLKPSSSWIGAISITVLLFFLIYLGIFPGRLVYLLQTLMS
jgi:NADH-quinone oxidoreductase subunit N